MSKVKRQGAEKSFEALKKEKKKSHLRLVHSASKVQAKPEVDADPESEKRQERLLKLLKLRKKAKEAEVKKVPGRRGRKPKVENLEVDPDSREEDSYIYEGEEVSLTYDAGISVVKEGRDDAGFLVDPGDKIEEELNFEP